MSNCGNDYMDEESPAFIEIEPDVCGLFHFGYIHCGIGWKHDRKRGTMGAGFTFEGSDEMDHTTRRGWAVMQNNGAPAGHVRFQRGDDSDFNAVRL